MTERSDYLRTAEEIKKYANRIVPAGILKKPKRSPLTAMS
jgi:hypothetical protein